MVATATSCHTPPSKVRTHLRGEGGLERIALVGAPNVGKSALFNRLTGAHSTVSNYPGTSVEIARGSARIGGRAVEVLDTPGMYSLVPATEEERVAREVVLGGGADVLVHVVDAKNLSRMLPLTLQLVETRRPLVLAVNMMDEAARLGLAIDAVRLADRLGVPVVPIAAVKGRGIDLLVAEIARARGSVPPPLPTYPNGVGAALDAIHGKLSDVYPVDPAALASLLLQGDADAERMIASSEPDGGAAAMQAARDAAVHFGAPSAYRASVERQRLADELLADVVKQGVTPGSRIADRLGRILAEPITGVPALLAVLYLGLYKFVGQFGAGTLVDFLETGVFETHVNPWFERVFRVIPWTAMRELIVGDYGVLTLGLRYAVAIILPVVGTFFLFFSILEDSGYFPRLALLVDRLFKRLGLSGRAVIPIVLGFACDTMATMVTRTLETRRERVLATLLLALAIPCSAQLGVILAILSGSPVALGVWAAAVAITFLVVGWLAAKLVPGSAATFHMELPPLRVPRPANVLTKTYTRMHWYFLEVLPLFLLASVLLWAGDLTGVLHRAIDAMRPVVGMLGLPAETASVFILGFFRRDYGAAGLYDMTRTGILSAEQLAVAAVTLTLFVPCVAQFLMMGRERGWKTAFGMLALITPLAFGAGWLVHVLFGVVGA